MEYIKRARYHLDWLESYLEEHPDLDPDVQSDLHYHLAELYTRLKSAERQACLMR